MAGVQSGVTQSFSINGIDARDYGVEIIGIDGRGLPTAVIPREFQFPDEAGARQYGDLPGVPVHRLSGYVIGDNLVDCRIKYGQFMREAGFIYDVEQQLVIRSVDSQMHVLKYFDEPHKTYKALYSGGSTRQTFKREQWRLGKYLNFTMEFKIPHIWAEGDEISETLSLSSSSHFKKVVTGTAPSRPRVIYKNTTADDVTTLDVVGAKFAFNTNFDDMDTSGNPKARGIKNDQNFAGDTSAGIYQTGKLSQGLALGGNFWFYNKTDESTPDSADNDRFNANQGSISMWVKSMGRDWDDGEKWVLFDAGNDGLQILKNTSDELEIIDADGGNNSVLDVSAYAAGTWYFVVGWWDTNGSSTKLRIYSGTTSINDGDDETSYTATTPGQKSSVGADVNGQYGAGCVIDDFRIYEAPLTSTERTNLINGGSGTTEVISNGSLLTYFTLDGTAGSDVASTVTGSSAVNRLDVSATTTTEITVAANGDDVFTGDDRFVCYDGTGYKKEGFISTDTDPTSTLITVDDTAGAGGSAITDLDKVGVSLDFDGSEYVTVANDATLNFGDATDFSLEAWVKTSSYAGMPNIIMKGSSGSGGKRYRMAIYYTDADAGKLTLIIDDDSSTPDITDTQVITDGKWHHVVGTFDRDGDMTAYVDGYSKGTADISGVGDIDDTGEPLAIGVDSESLSGNELTGQISEVRVYSKLLSAADVLWLATHPKPTKDEIESNTSAGDADIELIHEYFNESLSDASSNSNTGTHSGTPTYDQSAYVSRNLLADPGMENGGVAMGGITIGAVSPTALQKETSDVKFDTRSLNLAGDVNALFYQPVTTVSGENFLISEWYKVTAGAFKVEVDNNTSGNDNVSGTLNSATWAYFESAVELTGTTRIFQTLTSDSSDVNVDQLSLLPNLVDDGGMEDTLTNAWTQETNATMAADTDEHSGAQEMKITAGASLVGATQSVTLVDDTYYTVSGWARATDGDTARIIIDTGDGTTVTVGDVTATSYTRVSKIFLSTGTAGNIYLRAVANTDIVWFDDVAITRVDTTTGNIVDTDNFVPTRRGKGFQTGGNMITFGAVGNTDQWSCVWRGRPQFAYDISDDVTLIDHYFDSDNYFKLWYDASEDKFAFRKRADGSNYDTCVSKTMTFSADTEMDLICTFDTINGSQFYFDGSSSGSTSDSDTTALATGTTTLRGTAQAGSSTSITLASDASSSNDYYNSWVIEITGGTGSGQQRQISDYVGSTKVATVNTWTTTPDSTSTYIAYSSTVTIGGNASGGELASAIHDEIVIYNRKITSKEASAIHARNEPLHNTNAAVMLSATLGSGDFVEIDCDDLDIQQYDASGKQDISLLANGITTNNSRFFFLHPGDDLDDGDVLWCENTTGELEIRYNLRWI